MLKRRWRWMVPIVLVGLVLTGVYLKRRQDVYTARATVLIASQRISGALIPIAETDQLEKVSAIVGELLSRRNLRPDREARPLPADRQGRGAAPRQEGRDHARRHAHRDRRLEHGEHEPREHGHRLRDLLHVARPAEGRRRCQRPGPRLHGRPPRHAQQAGASRRSSCAASATARQGLAQLESEITQFKQTHRGELPSELVMNLGRLDRLQSQRQSLALQIAEAEPNSRPSPRAARTSIPTRPKRCCIRSRTVTRSSARSTPRTTRTSSPRQPHREPPGRDRPPRRDRRPHRVDERLSAARLTLEELRRRLAETVAEYDGLDRRVGLVPQVQEELAAMEGRAEVLRESHREFMRKVQQAELAEAVESAQQGERATVLDPAVPPSRAESSPFKMLAVMIVGSFGAAISFAILLELIDPVVVGIGDIEQKYRLPVLGSVAPLQ
ncbi:MAG: hypothetical protein R3E53_07395 [Myxococcota bacterium]